jgi:hypothetical protein
MKRICKKAWVSSIPNLEEIIGKDEFIAACCTRAVKNVKK